VAAGLFTVALSTSQSAQTLRSAGANLVIETFDDENLWTHIEKMRTDPL
jgi:hypothetical protein